MSRRLADHPASLHALEATLRWLREVDLRASIARMATPAVVLHGARDACDFIAA